MNSFPQPGDAGYAPDRLIDTLVKMLHLKNDSALAEVLNVAPSVLSKIRHQTLPVGATMLLAIHDLTDLSFNELRSLMRQPRRKPQRVYVAPEIAAARLKLLQDIAMSRGGECVASAYVRVHSPMRFYCPEHGFFNARPHHVLAGGWCMGCAIEKQKDPTRKRLVEYIRQRDGVLLSPYINARTHVVIRCKVHGEWRATPDNLLNKRSWCNFCARSLPRPGRRKKKSGMACLL